jgi:peptide subunit release factor RF-3
MEAVKRAIDSRTMLVFDRFDRPLILFPNIFTLNFFKERFPSVTLVEATEI